VNGSDSLNELLSLVHAAGGEKSCSLLVVSEDRLAEQQRLRALDGLADEAEGAQSLATTLISYPGEVRPLNRFDGEEEDFGENVGRETVEHGLKRWSSCEGRFVSSAQLL
jgi:hypothetical protein